jgi:hypothetical protein
MQLPEALDARVGVAAPVEAQLEEGVAGEVSEGVMAVVDDPEV